MKIRNTVLFALVMLFAGPEPGRCSATDSLKQLIRNAPDDTNKVNTLLLLSSNLYRSDPEGAVRYAEDAIGLSEKLGFLKGKAYSLKAIGMAYYFQAKYLETVNYWKESLALFDSIGYRLGSANMLNNLGAIYFNQGEDTRALEYYLESLKASESIGDTLRIVTAMINIGGVYFNKPATHDKALEYYRKALPLCRLQGDDDAIGTCTVNMGEIYLVRKEYDTALHYFNTSLDALRKTGGNVPYSLLNIGKVYAAQGAYNQAIRVQTQAYELARNNSAKLEMTQSLLSLANTYEKQGSARQAIETYLLTRDIGEEIRANNELKETYEGLARLYSAEGDYKNAFAFLTSLISIKDTLYNAENDKKIQRLQFNFDLEKKQGQIDLLTKDKELQALEMRRQKIVRNALFAGFVLILTIAFILVRSIRAKIRTNRILDRQKAEIENLILNILPAEIAGELQESGVASPRYYDSVSILFTDFKGFSKLAEDLSPKELVRILNDYFVAFDDIVHEFNLEKIKTIGDSYMCAGGIPGVNDTHARDAVRAGLAMQEHIRVTNEKRRANGEEPWDLRIGIHTGPIVAGVVGKKKYAYDIWGNSVNVSSRMESNGEPGKVNISAATYELVKDIFPCTHRGKIYAKNIGDIDMYFVGNAPIDHER